MKKNRDTRKTFHSAVKFTFLKSSFCLLTFLIFLLPASLFAQQGEWTWMGGSNTVNGTAVYGTLGVPSTSNHPEGFYEAGEWTDTAGMFWLYGGSSSSFESANLWRYNPNTNEWTWMNGPGALWSNPVYGTQGVSDPANTPGSRGFAPTTWTSKDGNLWLFGGYAFGSNNDLWRYDISSNEWTWMKGPNTTGDPGSYGTQGVPDSTNVPMSRSECAMSWVDSVGNMWLFGGWIGSGSLNDLWRYDPLTNEWTWMKGSSTYGAWGVYGTLGVPSSTNTPGSRNSYTKWTDGHNLYLFGGDDFSAGNEYNDVWKYIISTNEWVWISGNNYANGSTNAGSQCDAATSHHPSGRREGRACWVDPCKKFWLYGGSSESSFQGSHSDLWKFDPVTLEWRWVSGSLNTLQSGSFGTQGVSSPTNLPSSRSGNNAWCDKQGNLWMFGGCDVGWPSSWNDLWRYVPDTTCGGGNCPLANNGSAPGFAANDTDICEKFCINFSDLSQNNPTSWQWLFPGGIPSSSTAQNPTNICYNVPGIYDVTLITTNANGNDTLMLAGYITVYTNPFAPVITQTGNTLMSTPATSYQWQFNSADIPGATNQSYTISQSGLYTVIIGDGNDCTAQASVDASYVGIDEVNGSALVNVYPNPAGDVLTVEFSYAKASENGFTVSISNAIGQEVYSSEAFDGSPSFRQTIDVSAFANGVYFVTIQSEKYSLMKKVVVLH